MVDLILDANSTDRCFQVTIACYITCLAPSRRNCPYAGRKSMRLAM